jgi:hypothetical protein
MGVERYRRKLNNRVRDLLNLGNRGKWDRFYESVADAQLYGDQVSYERAAEFLADVREVEDWGCGLGGFRKFCRTRYIGVDGSESRFADRIADLANYRSEADGILIRHVLEHDYRWRKILDNAVVSFRSKMCLVLFTPLTAKTSEIAYNHDYAVPDIAFRQEDITSRFGLASWTAETNLHTDTQYGVEHIFYLTRPAREFSGADI